jgi:hypothetical protein
LDYELNQDNDWKRDGPTEARFEGADFLKGWKSALHKTKQVDRTYIIDRNEVQGIDKVA